MKLPVILGTLLFSTSALAINTSSYVEINVVKAWDKTIDVYFVNQEEHQCEGSSKTRFLIDATKNHHVSFILTAFAANKKVQFA